MKKFFKGLYLCAVLLFLYAPIVIMIIYSFNDSKSRAIWGGFTLNWYVELFQSESIMNALWVTLRIGVLSAVLATALGTLAAIGMHAMKTRPRAVLTNLSYLPMTMPDIVTGVSLMLMFIEIKFPLGFFTMLLAHISFNVPHVIFSVLPKLQQMDQNMYEAALDLGATPTQALWKIILPEIRPGMMTGLLLSFTLSIDDFVISYFTTSTEVNLSTLVYSMARMGIKPSLNALSAVMFAAVLVLMLIINRRTNIITGEHSGERSRA